ncbi:MAG TPA: PspA/IM30 family protein [Candidatus Dormibacteraeota bacterium]|nr:PspA/IM30 family protein [Candidatus Dormibacteraeota bacterium]HEV2475445.1 PspA/IM30 family protein [Candidatus Dormibacteraeota bacterium]
MGIVDRLKVLLAKGAGVALAPAPDPRVTHLTTHQKQRALLNQVIRAGEQVAAAKERLKTTADAVRAKLPAMEESARSELRSGNESAARLALQRRQVVAGELETLERQLAEVEKEESVLAMIEQRLSGQIEAFAARQEVIKARYSAAEAQVRINEAMTGVSQDLADLTAALHRAEQTTEDMQARASAIDQLVQDGDLESLGFAAGSDAIDARYQTLGAGDEVERRLNALKELG